MEKPIVCEGCKVPKGWGEELIIENNEKYCGKLLIFKAGCKFSMHYHMIKDETWYVDKGEFIYKWIDTETADVIEQHLKARGYSKTKTWSTTSINCPNRWSYI
jgi:hypothetical protein